MIHLDHFARLCAAALMCATMSAAHADLSYDLADGLQGFRLNDATAGRLTWDPEGYLRVQDLTDATNVHLLLPGQGLQGGWEAYAGGTLTFDARLLSPIASYWPEFGHVLMLSMGGNAAVDVVPDNEPGTTWKTYAIRLEGATFGMTDAAFADTLRALQDVQINMEAGNGAIETVLIDNVRVTAVPEPSTWLLSALGLMTLGAAARRRRV